MSVDTRVQGTRRSGTATPTPTLDELEVLLHEDRERSRLRPLWAAIWPKLIAVGVVVVAWQALYSSGWKPDYLFASPTQAVDYLVHDLLATSRFWDALRVTMSRAVLGFAVALVVGSLLGIAVSQWKVLRSGIGSLITGLQTMPSIAWFPFAMLAFGLSESAIYFVVILGAAPSIANGIINGVDDIPPTLLRAGHMMGAGGWKRYAYVVVPAAFPSYLGGLSQGWAFAWRALMAGELFVQIPGSPAIGTMLNNAYQAGQPAFLLAVMIVVLVIGMAMDSIFSGYARHARVRRGLTGFRG